MKKIIMCCVFIISIMALAVTAQEPPAGESNNKQGIGKITYSGYGYFMFGQIVDGIMGVGIPAPTGVKDKLISHYWDAVGDVDFYFASRLRAWFTAKAGISLTTYALRAYGNYNKNEVKLFYQNVDGFIPMAEGIFNLDFSDCSLLIECGLFQYMFNPEVKNLGNYLYRSTAYPLSIHTKIDYPYADMAGLRVQLGFLENKLKVETILNSSINFPPWYDWDLGFVGTYTAGKILDVGAGVSFTHLFSVGDKLLSELPDSVKDMFKGTKWTARAIVDPKPLFGSPDIFGPKDLKIYGEAAILGMKNNERYGYLPDSGKISGIPWERMPVLLGFNIPTFKIVDYLSVELEWFKSPFPNDWYGQYPTPVARESMENDTNEFDTYLNGDNFKWSIYLAKSISKFEVKLMFANDHTIYKGCSPTDRAYTEQTLKRNADWHWYLKLQYNL